MFNRVVRINHDPVQEGHKVIIASVQEDHEDKQRHSQYVLHNSSRGQKHGGNTVLTSILSFTIFFTRLS